MYSRRARVFQKRGLNAIERAETVRGRGVALVLWELGLKTIG